MADRRPTKGNSDTRSRSSEGGYQWTCPYCGESRVNKLGDDGGKEGAIAALRTHIQASDGGGHGPRHSFPSESLTFSEFVAREVGER